MAYWIMKTEPESYSFQQLVAEKKARWDGVSNPVALRNMRAMHQGDEVMIYHTGKEKACIGLARVASEPYADPTDDSGRLFVIDITPVRELKRAVPLAEIKGTPELADLALVRQPRLSVMPATPAQWAKILAMAV